MRANLFSALAESSPSQSPPCTPQPSPLIRPANSPLFIASSPSSARATKRQQPPQPGRNRVSITLENAPVVPPYPQSGATIVLTGRDEPQLTPMVQASPTFGPQLPGRALVSSPVSSVGSQTFVSATASQTFKTFTNGQTPGQAPTPSSIISTRLSSPRASGVSHRSSVVSDFDLDGLPPMLLPPTTVPPMLLPPTTESASVQPTQQPGAAQAQVSQSPTFQRQAKILGSTTSQVVTSVSQVPATSSQAPAKKGQLTIVIPTGTTVPEATSPSGACPGSPTWSTVKVVRKGAKNRAAKTLEVTQPASQATPTGARQRAVTTPAPAPVPVDFENDDGGITELYYEGLECRSIRSHRRADKQTRSVKGQRNIGYAVAKRQERSLLQRSSNAVK